MSTRKNFKKAILATIPFLIILVVALSCRKDNFIEDTVEPPVDPGNWIVPYVFPDKPVDIMTEYENSTHTDFPGKKIHDLGENLGGGEHGWKSYVEGGMEVGHILWEAYDYIHTESRFDDIDEQLNEIQGQIEELNEKMNGMNDLLNVLMFDQTSYEATSRINDKISSIKSEMDASSPKGFMYFPKIMAAYQADSTNPDNIKKRNDLHEQASTYAKNIYNIENSNPASMINLITSINTDLCTDLGTGENALHAYARTLAMGCKGKEIDSATAMNAYLYFESYFLTIVNSQFQAATIQMCASHYAEMADNTTGYSQSFWEDTFSPLISSELNEFLKAVDYLVINMSEYRTPQRFANDMQYAGAGLAPDNIFYQVLARSQFLVSMINDVIGTKHSVINGHIIIPSRYTTDGKTLSPQISLNVGSSTIKSSANHFTSMIPYTYWASEDNVQTCNPDNNWLSYRFSTSTSDSVWSGSPQSIKVVATGSDALWPHTNDIEGNITPLYYNPRDPRQTSKTKTDSCTFQFAYFSANWQWGYLLLSQSAKSSGWNVIPDKFDTQHFNDLIYGKGFWPSVPFAGNTTTRWSDGGYHFGASKNITFSNTNDIAGAMNAKGNRPSSSDKDYYFIMGDYLVRTIKTGSTTTPNSDANNALEAWGTFNGICNTSGTRTSKFSVSMGTSCTSRSTAKSMEADNQIDGTASTTLHSLDGDIFEKTYSISSSTYNCNYFNKKSVKKATTYKNTGFGFYLEEYQSKKASNTLPVDIAINFGYQFVYTGTYNLQ